MSTKNIRFGKALQDAINKQKQAEEKSSDTDSESEDVEDVEDVEKKPKKEKKEKKPKSLTGYNIFIREKWAEVKANKKEDEKLVATELSKEFSRQWKKLSPEERQRYSELADKYNEEHGLPATKKKKERDGHPREPNAYQAWMQRPEVKDKINEYPASERRKVRSKMWKEYKLQHAL